MAERIQDKKEEKQVHLDDSALLQTPKKKFIGNYEGYHMHYLTESLHSQNQQHWIPILIETGHWSKYSLNKLNKQLSTLKSLPSSKRESFANNDYFFQRLKAKARTAKLFNKLFLILNNLDMSKSFSNIAFAIGILISVS